MGISRSERKCTALGLYANKENIYSKRQLAEALDISESSLYYRGIQEEKDLKIKKEIEELHEIDDTLGSRKLAIMLDQGRGSVTRVMLKYGIEARPQQKKYRYGGKSDEIVPNKLLSIENIENYEIVFSDLFEFKLGNGKKVYCCFMLRKKTRQILSFSYAYHMRGELVSNSVKHILLLKNLRDADIIFHSDQGTQYGSVITVDQLIEYGFDRSMSRAGTPTDNGYAERFVGIFKHSVANRYVYDNLEDFAEVATKWLNFYNERRPHQSLGQKSPNAFACEKGLGIVHSLAIDLL